VDHLRVGDAFRNSLRAILLEIRTLHDTFSFAGLIGTPLVFFTAQLLIKKKGALVKDYLRPAGLAFPDEYIYD